MPSQRETYEVVTGSSAEMWDWYESFRAEPAWPHMGVPDSSSYWDGWTVTGRIVYYEDDAVDFTIGHGDVVRAMQRIADGEITYASTGVTENARLFLSDPDMADFDAGTADEVIQVAVLKEVIFG